MDTRERIRDREQRLAKLAAETAEVERELLGLYRRAFAEPSQAESKAAVEALESLSKPAAPSVEIRPIRLPDGTMGPDVSAVIPLVQAQFFSKNGRAPDEAELHQIVEGLRAQILAAAPAMKPGDRLQFTIPQT